MGERWFTAASQTEDSFLFRKVRKKEQRVPGSSPRLPGPRHSMPFTTSILLVLLAAISVSCLEPPPKRIDLFRFFMGFGPEESPVQKVSFNPEAGLRFREQYERKYGPRGQLLIERFGQGLAMQGPSVVDVDQLLDVPHKNKTKHYRTNDFNSTKSKGKKQKSITIDIQLSSTASPENSEP